jgi:hypothetical protein
MRDLELFAQYLVRMRQEKLQLSHATLLAGATLGWADTARTLAFEAELCSRIHQALKELERDPAHFIEHNLRSSNKP